MSSIVTLNNVQYTLPGYSDTGWGANTGNVLTQYLVAIASNTLQPSGGSFTLTADIDFGANFGLKALFLKSETTNPASAGVLRLAKTDAIKWRNNANGADISLAIDASDNLQYNATKVLLSGAVVNADINASAAIAYSKLALTGSIVNADINASAAIAYSKLTLTGSILNADVNASAAIALSKLAALGTAKALQSNSSTGVIEVSSVTNTELGYVSGVTSAIQTQLDSKAAYTTLSGKRRPALVYSSGSVVACETGNDGTAGQATIIFPDGVTRSDSTAGDINCNLAQVAAFSSGTIQSGLRTGTVTANRYYAFFAVKVTKGGETSKWVMIADQSDFYATTKATYDGYWGANGWVYLGSLPYGDNSGATTAIPSFVMVGDEVSFYNTCSAGGRGLPGVRLANTAGATSLTWTYAAGTVVSSAQVPSGILIGTIASSNESASQSYFTDAAAGVQLAGAAVATAGIWTNRVSNWALVGGARLLTGSSVASGITLCGYKDRSLSGPYPLY